MSAATMERPVRSAAEAALHQQAARESRDGQCRHVAFVRRHSSWAVLSSLQAREFRFVDIDATYLDGVLIASKEVRP